MVDRNDPVISDLNYGIELIKLS